jgi:hypothetical protein
MPNDSVSSSRKRVIILSSSEDEIVEVIQESLASKPLVAQELAQELSQEPLVKQKPVQEPLASETVAVKEPVSVRGRDRVRLELIAHSFLRTWLAFKVRKGQKEALKVPGRHDNMSHPTSKFYDLIMGLYTLTKFQIDTTLLTPSKMLSRSERVS